MLNFKVRGTCSLRCEECNRLEQYAIKHAQRAEDSSRKARDEIMKGWWKEGSRFKTRCSSCQGGLSIAVKTNLNPPPDEIDGPVIEMEEERKELPPPRQPLLLGYSDA